MKNANKTYYTSLAKWKQVDASYISRPKNETRLHARLLFAVSQKVVPR